MPKIKIQIKSFGGSVLFEWESEDNTIKKTLEKAIASSANLSSANLRYADLSYADLSSADLSSADLSSANLRYANLSSADLSSANLRSANLRSANLRYADLSYADLSSADLSSADLSSANLRSANLRYAKGISKIYRSELNILKHQKGKVRAFKYLNGKFSPYQNTEYKIGETYTVKKFNSDESILCGEGLNVATLEWCLRDTNCDLDKTYIVVEFDAKDIVAIPINSDGKFRVKKFKIIRKLTKKELENVTNDKT